MFATAERVPSEDSLGEAEIIWHLPADLHTCDGNCDYHEVVCGEPGVSVPGGTRDVPDDLDRPGERWCGACLSGQTPSDTQELVA
jgi:hypothetical protein